MKIIRNAAVLCLAAFAISTVACASASSKKNAARSSAAKTATAAKGAKEKSGSKAQAGAPKGENKGATFEDAACDAEAEGVGFCGDDAHVVLCQGGIWYAVNCGALEAGAFCGEQDGLVDCYTE